MQLVKVKLAGSGDIVELIPSVAYARINGGTAELVIDPNKQRIETTESPKPAKAENAVAPAQKQQTSKKK